MEFGNDQCYWWHHVSRDRKEMGRSIEDIRVLECGPSSKSATSIRILARNFCSLASWLLIFSHRRWRGHELPPPASHSHLDVILP